MRDDAVLRRALRLMTCARNCLGLIVSKSVSFYFGYEMPSCLLVSKFDKFFRRYNCVENEFCRYCCTLVRSKWKRLIRGTEEDSDDSGG